MGVLADLPVPTETVLRDAVADYRLSASWVGAVPPMRVPIRGR